MLKSAESNKGEEQIRAAPAAETGRERGRVLHANLLGTFTLACGFYFTQILTSRASKLYENSSKIISKLAQDSPPSPAPVRRLISQPSRS